MKNLVEVKNYVMTKKLNGFSDEYLEIDTLIEPLVQWLNSKNLITFGSCSSHLKKEKQSRSDYINNNGHRAYVAYCIPYEEYENYLKLKEEMVKFLNKYLDINTFSYEFFIDTVKYTTKIIDFKSFSDMKTRTSHFKYIYDFTNPNEIRELLIDIDANEVIHNELLEDNILTDSLHIEFLDILNYEYRINFFRELYDFFKIPYSKENLILKERRKVKIIRK